MTMTPTPTVTITATPTLTPQISNTPSVSLTPQVSQNIPISQPPAPPEQGGYSAQILPFLNQDGGTTNIIMGRFDGYNSQVLGAIGGGTPAQTELNAYSGVRAKEIQGWFTDNVKFLLYSGVSLLTINSSGTSTFKNGAGTNTLLIEPDGTLTHPGNLNTTGNTTIKGSLNVSLTTRIGGILNVDSYIISAGTVIASGLDLVATCNALTAAVATAQSTANTALAAAQAAQATADAAAAAAAEAAAAAAAAEAAAAEAAAASSTTTEQTLI